MKRSSRDSAPASLPVTRDLKPVYGLSLIVAILMTGALVAGLLAPDALYPTAALRASSGPNDAVNLLLGLPILLGAMALTRRGKLLGLFFRASALFVGLILVLLLRPLLTPAPFVLADVIVIAVMTLICLVPFTPFTRGVVSKGK